MKKRRRLIVLLTVAVAVALTTVSFIVSPVPASRIMRKLFEKPKLAPPFGYAEMELAVTVEADIVYPSANGDNTLDLYRLRDESASAPVIIWVHGGAYVGGDKSDVRLYATALASEGYAVIAMNYERAPEARYPVPITQLGEVTAWVEENADRYKLDTSRIVLAGDSAGAHTAATFALIQTNPEYAQKIGIKPTLNAERLRGLLLYCGPYDVDAMDKIGGVFGFMLGRAGWAYFGVRDWTMQHTELATIKNHVTAAFPPTLITDGNTASFELHGRELAAALEVESVPVETYFIPLEAEKTMHEYQFQMNTPAGTESYRRTLAFLSELR